MWVAGSRLPRLQPTSRQKVLQRQVSPTETDPVRYVASRATALHERLNFVGAAARGELDDVEIEDGKPTSARSKPTVPDGALTLQFG